MLALLLAASGVELLSLLQELTFGRLHSRLGKTGTSSVLHSLLQEFIIFRIGASPSPLPYGRGKGEGLSCFVQQFVGGLEATLNPRHCLDELA